MQYGSLASLVDHKSVTKLYATVSEVAIVAELQFQEIPTNINVVPWGQIRKEHSQLSPTIIRAIARY